jgi:hypothetical protein
MTSRNFGGKHTPFGKNMVMPVFWRSLLEAM